MPENLHREPSASAAANELNEKDLAELLRRKDPAGMRLFYDRYVGCLTALCLRYVPDRVDAKDILQDAFVNMFAAADKFQYRGEGCLKAWASRIVVNGALKSLRQSGRLLPMKEIPDLPEEELPDRLEVPPEVIQQFICALPDGYRTVFNLYVFEQKSHREIAELLGIREDSSASQYFRARALLARQIKTYLKDHE